eukprot:m.94582 g.94582  ORF g.94582 m.94582 type:complete len:95 (+) comp15002_c0_seq62:2606-2890(+)
MFCMLCSRPSAQDAAEVNSTASAACVPAIGQLSPPSMQQGTVSYGSSVLHLSLKGNNTEMIELLRAVWDKISRLFTDVLSRVPLAHARSVSSPE